jgi:hypothetical protein
MRYTKSGKPVCFSCRRVGLYVYEYRSHGQPAFAYYCAFCASVRPFHIVGNTLVLKSGQTRTGKPYMVGLD